MAAAVGTALWQGAASEGSQWVEGNGQGREGAARIGFHNRQQPQHQQHQQLWQQLQLV
jgi:hypothetical protein